MSATLGYGSDLINFQLVPVPVQAAYDPMIFGPVYTGSAWPKQGVYTVPPVLPAPSLQSAMAPTAYGASGSSPSYPTAVNSTGNPFSLKKSPVIWVLLFLGFALFMLHKVHW